MEQNFKQPSTSRLSWVAHSLRSHTTGWIALGCILAAPLLWMTLAFFLGASRGLGLRDEGLYLLAANPPSGTASWAFPFGWHTGPLFAAVGYDIASFRTLGAFILVVTSAALGISTSKVLAGNRGAFTSTITALTVITAVLGSMFYYIPMLRTPSYNWLNLVGIQILIAATLAGAMRWTSSKSMASSRGLVLIAGVAGFGLFFTIPAKPSTFPILLILSAATFLLCHGLRRAVTWTVAVLVSMTFWLVLALVAGIWPSNFLSTFWVALRFPLGQTTSEAIQAVVMLPNELVINFSWLSKPQLIASAFALVLMVIPILARKKWVGFRVSGFLIIAITAASISGLDIPILSEKVLITDWPAPERTMAGLIILFSSLLMIIYPRTIVASSAQKNVRLRVATIVLLVSAPLLFSYGSYIGPLRQSGVVAGFLFLAAIVVLSFSPSQKTTLVLMSIVALVASLITINGVVAGWKNPYGAAALVNQAVSTSVGSSESELYLTEELSSSLNTARRLAEIHGWKSGTPLIDLTYPWNPGVPYFLGARVPDSLMMTIFGYSNSQDIFEFHLSQPFSEAFPFKSAWLLTSDSDSIDTPAQDAVSRALGALSDFTGRAFPEEYDCIDLGEYVMWRPTDNSHDDAEACDLSTLQDYLYRNN